MDNVNKKLVMTGYDKFRCTADKCSLTCCEGWNISVDGDTYDKWLKNSEISKGLETCVRKSEENDEYKIEMNERDECPFLNESGLCRIVTAHGEDYISETCRKFPRVENDFNGSREYTLSCACPETVEIISNISGKVRLEGQDIEAEDGDVNLASFVRETLVNIVQKDGFEIEERLIAGFQMLIDVLDSEDLEENVIIGAVDRYNEDSYIERIVGEARSQFGDFELSDSVEEVNNLLIDITENYKNIRGIKTVIEEVVKYAEEADIDKLTELLGEYKKDFAQFNGVLENCIVSKIYGRCISSDIEDVIISYQMIIMEFILIRYAAFINSQISGETQILAVKNYITIFTRIIENNSNAFQEFIESGFECDILDIGYLCFTISL